MATNSWREELLDGVSVVPKVGIPGTMVVLGEDAEPVLTASTVKDVLVAAAQHGQGRVIVFTHGAYALWFQKRQDSPEVERFKQNTLKWLTNGNYSREWNLLDIDRDGIEGAHHLEKTAFIWKPSRNNDHSLVDRLKDYVARGVSLIVAMTPWGHLKGGIKIEELAAYQLLRAVGIHLTGDVLTIQKDGALVSRNQAQNAHIGRLVKKCISGQMKISGLLQEHIVAINSLTEETSLGLLRSFAEAVPFPCRAPSKKKPLKSEEDRIAASFMNMVMLKIPVVAPGVHEFPGNFESPPPLSCFDFEVNAFTNQVHPVGAYLPPGGTMTIQVLEGDSNEWQVQVGCHTDKLLRKDVMKRWPEITIRRYLSKDGPTQVHSSFGGSVYLYSPNGTNTLKVRFVNVVLSPLYNIKDEEIGDKWNEVRTHPGLWADFVGNHIQITVPSETIRDIELPRPVVDFWDSVVSMHNDLKGSDVTNKRREWIVPDMQPSAGYMHAGYPIVTQLDAADRRKNMFLMRRPSSAEDQAHWGYFHELGHNMQDGRWTFGGTGEVTCNVFALHAMYILYGIQPWQHPWLQNQKPGMKRYLRAGAEFTEWTSNPGIALGIYAQLARDFGFDAYKKVFRAYDEENPTLPSNTAKMDYWVKTFSKVVERNLVPAFKLWGFPISDDVSEELRDFTAYTPDDEVTRVVETEEPQVLPSCEVGETIPCQVDFLG